MAQTFTTNLDALTEERFDQLARDAGARLGRLPSWRGRRLPDRADVLRATLAVLERDPGARSAVIAQIRTDRLERHTNQQDPDNEVSQ